MAENETRGRQQQRPPQQPDAGQAVAAQDPQQQILPPGDPPQPAQRPARRPGRDFGEIHVEVANRKNRQVQFGPTGERLRGRFDWQNLPRGTTSEQGLHEMPTLPGRVIVLNTRERWAEIRDPLAEPENAQLLRDAQEVYKRIYSNLPIPVDKVRYEDMTDDQLATWLYWLWRHTTVHDKKLGADMVCRSGKVPGLEDIARAFPDARIRRNFFDSLALRRQQQETDVSDVVSDYEEGQQAHPSAAARGGRQ